jgi:predicted acetyltransferase
VPHLVAPDVRFRDSFAAAMAEFRAEGRGSSRDHSVLGGYLYRAGSWTSDEAFSEFVAALRANRLEETTRPAGFVPDTELWWVDGDEFLGRIVIRHRLTPTLLETGGHIGYDVRPSARRRGHATEMLRQALVMAHELRVDPALITCDAANVASRTVIERNGGVLEDQRGSKLRFWVPTSDRGRRIRGARGRKRPCPPDQEVIETTSGFNRSMQHHGEWWRIDREVCRWRRRAGQA